MKKRKTYFSSKFNYKEKYVFENAKNPRIWPSYNFHRRKKFFLSFFFSVVWLKKDNFLGGMVAWEQIFLQSHYQ